MKIYKIITIGLCLAILATTMATTVTAKDYQPEVTQGKTLITVLSDGWNYISIPFDKEIKTDDLLVVYRTRVFTWDESLDLKIIRQDPITINRETGIMEVTRSLKPGYGYAVKSLKDDVALFVNEKNIPESESLITFLPKKSWQLFGLPFSHEITIGDLLVVHMDEEYSFEEAAKLELVYGVIYNWNRETQSWDYLWSNDDILQPGFGYYIETLTNDLILKVKK